MKKLYIFIVALITLLLLISILFLKTIIDLQNYSVTTNTISSNPYVPNNMTVDTNENILTEELQTDFNRSIEKVTIEVLEYTITRESASILITDNNLKKYGWGNSFRLQKKVNTVWEELKEINDLNFISMSYEVNENNQLTLDTNYGKYYGELKNGIYRIVKSVYDNGYIDLFSNEFEIK